MRITITNRLLAAALCCMMVVSFSTNLLAQTFPTSCTSKDLTLLKASLPAPAGSRCLCSGDRSLILGIHNGTGSIRTSFALWGMLVKKDASGNILSSKSLFACAGPIPANGDYFLNATTIIIDGVPQTPPSGSSYPTIHIDCGESLDITNMHLAWTSATAGATCESLYNSPSTINPKCGVQDLIHVDLGLEAGVSTTQSTCTTKGQIVISPKGGLVPYQVCLYKKNTATDSTLISCATVNGTTTTTATFGNLDDATYTATTTDNMGASASLRCFVDRFITITNPDNVSAPNCTVTDPACRQTTGTVNVTSPQTGVTYTLEKPLGTVLYTASSGVFSNVSPDTYILKATKGVCSATKTNVVVNNPPATPATPAPTNNGPICAGSTLNLTANVTADSYSWTGPGGFTSTAQNPSRTNTTTAMAGSYSLVITVNGCSSNAGSTTPVINAQPLAPTIIISQQPNLCSNSTGSISLCSPNASYTYEISTNGGTSYTNAQTGSSISFTNLAAGSNPIVRVTNGSTGCAATANCSNAVATCPNPANPTNAIKQTEQFLQLAEPTVNAYPNPFNDRVKFVVNAPAAGNGRLDIYNVMGQKIKTVYQGYINSGSNSFELTISKKQQQTLVYIFSVGDKKVTGKLLQLNN
jgi:hypothetical protein